MKNTKYLIGSILMLVMPLSGFAANLTTTWNGGSAGAYPWETAGNWNNGVPNNGANNYQAVIEDSTGNRVITTSGAVTASRLLITQSTATAGAGTTLQLGGDFLVNGNSISGFSNSVFNNSTGDASKLVIDLNGYNFSVESTLTFTSLTASSNFTIKSSDDAGGVFALRRITSTATNVHVENNVTLKLTQAQTAAQDVSGYTFSSASTLWLVNLYGNGTFSFTGGTVGNLLIGGDFSTSQKTAVSLQSNLRVQGSVTLDTHNGATGGDASLLTLNSRNLYVGGAFTDKGTNNDTYGSGTIYFNGNPATEQAVSIGRQSLSNNFQVGENASSKGNIVLEKNLTTTGTFNLLADSRLNVQTQTLQASTVTLQNGADVALTFGLASGSIVSTGALLLDGFNLQLTYDGSGWLDGSKLVLFSYADSLTGTPTLSSFSGSLITYDTLVHDTVLKEVYLSNVAIIPEPGSLALLALGGGLLLAVALRRRIH